MGDLYSTLDLSDVYSQIPLDEKSKKLTVINTHRGLLCYNHLLIGVSALAIFQRTVETILMGIAGVQVYLNDMLVAENKRDGRIVLKVVRQRCRENGVKLRKSKCTLRSTEVSYLGHRISSERLQPLEEKLEAVMKAQSHEGYERKHIAFLHWSSDIRQVSS